MPGDEAKKAKDGVLALFLGSKKKPEAEATDAEDSPELMAAKGLKEALSGGSDQDIVDALRTALGIIKPE